MIGDGYFALRAQIGTALFSLGRLAMELGAEAPVLKELRTAQSAVRERFLWLVTSAPGAAYPAVLNALFDREFCGAVEPAAAGRTVVFEYATAASETVIGAGMVEFRRPYTFLRDFAIVDAPPEAGTAALAPFVLDAEVILFIIGASQPADEAVWAALGRLGTAALARTVVVLVAREAVLPGVAEEAARQWRLKMQRGMSQECPVFVVSPSVPGGMNTLERHLNEDVIFSAVRRSRFRRLVDRAAEIAEGLAGPLRARDTELPRDTARLRDAQTLLTEREGQTQRQMAGGLWKVTQSFGDLQEQLQRSLRRRIPALGLIFGKWSGSNQFAADFERRAQASLREQLKEVLENIEHGAVATSREITAAQVADFPPPVFPREEVEKEMARLETPLGLPAILHTEISRAGKITIAPLVFLAAMLVASILVGWLMNLATAAILLAVGAFAGLMWLIVLERRLVVRKVGRYFGDNRAAFMAAFEPVLGNAVAAFYNELSTPLEKRSLELAAEREKNEPLLTRLKKLEEGLAKCSAELTAKEHEAGARV